MVKLSLIPREPKFFDMFERSVANVVATTKEFCAFMEDFTLASVPQRVSRITELEHEGDHIAHTILEELHSTFVTPLDREDIAELAQRLDDVVDLIEAAANAMFLYKVNEPTQRAKELATVLCKMAEQLAQAIPRLRKRSQMKFILKNCVEINRLENEADSIQRHALAELFDRASVTDIIKWREIYGHLEDAADRGEDVANVLEGVVLKHG